MLPEQTFTGTIVMAMYGPTNLPLKFMEAGVSKTTFPAVGWVGGWVGGWPVKMEIRLNSALAEARA